VTSLEAKIALGSFQGKFQGRIQVRSAIRLATGAFIAFLILIDTSLSASRASTTRGAA
jgi:hypothetical protein